MENQHKQIIVNEIESYQSQKELSQNALAKDIGISPAQLMNVLDKDKWDKVSNRMWNKLSAHFMAPDSDWKLFKTMNHNLLIELLKDATVNSRFLACSADSGLGKTTTLKQYEFETPNAFYVLTHSIMTQRDFLMAILRSMGQDEDTTMTKMVALITEKLNGLSNPVLMFDDYGKANDSIYRVTQLLFDLTEGHCGIVLAGTTYLLDYVYLQSAKNKKGFREFKRRVEYWLGLHRPSLDIVGQICKQNGIDDPNVINYVHSHCDNYGTLKALITNAKKVGDGAISMDVISSVKIGDRDYEASV